MFFAKPGKFPACKLFTLGHFILFIITIIIIAVALFFTRKKNEKSVLKIIRSVTILLWILEILKIIFNLVVGNGKNPNNYGRTD